jgi:monoglucosyldiacylglycerol epimerase
VIVTPNPLTYVLMPLATLSRWAYFRLTSRGSRPAIRNPGP